MEYTELFKELRTTCFCHSHVNMWLNYREEEINALSFTEYRNIYDEAEFIKDCDAYCI